MRERAGQFAHPLLHLARTPRPAVRTLRGLSRGGV